jgi:hypothetical protein
LHKTFQVDGIQYSWRGGRTEPIAPTRKSEEARRIPAAMGWEVVEVEARTRLGSSRDGPDPPEEEKQGR